MENEKQETKKEEIGGDENSLVKKKRSKKTAKEKENLRMFFIGYTAFIGVTVVVVSLVGVFQVYVRTSTNVYTHTVAKILRLPALKINGSKVLYSDYLDDLKAIAKVQKYEVNNGGAGIAMTTEEMSDQVLWRLANNSLVYDGIKSKKIDISEDDIDNLKNQFLQQFTDTATAEKELMDRYGWTFNDYVEKVMKPYIMQSELDAYLQTDTSSLTEIYNIAAKVLQDIQSGASFASSAQKYGQDGTAPAGGDLGWFKKGDMVPEFEVVAFALKKDEIASQPIQTQYGYHIIKLTDSKKEKVQDSDGNEVEEESIRASHILFRNSDLDWYLDKTLRTANIHFYLRVNNPFDDYLKTISK
ncbi:MAG: peptidylprolyl isomerase [bacterium]